MLDKNQSSLTTEANSGVLYLKQFKMNKLSDLQLTDAQREILTAIKNDGKFSAHPVDYGGLKDELKNLMWKEYIERDKANGLNLNVFVAGWFFPLLEKLDF